GQSGAKTSPNSGSGASRCLGSARAFERGLMRLALRLIAVIGALFVLLAPSAHALDPLSPTATPVPPSVADAIARIEAKARHAHSTWGLLVADAKTGQVLVSQNSEKLFTPGSTLKLYSAAAALHDYGAGRRFRTPVYRTGSVRHGVLS